MSQKASMIAPTMAKTSVMLSTGGKLSINVQIGSTMNSSAKKATDDTIALVILLTSFPLTVGLVVLQHY